MSKTRLTGAHDSCPDDSCDPPNFVFHSVAQDLLHRRSICMMPTLCMGTTTSCTPSHRSHSAQTDQRLAQSEQSFLSFARGLHLFSRSSAPSSLSSSRSPFRTFRVSFRLRNWYNNSGMRCRPQTLRSIYSWCHKTCPVSSRQFPQNVFTKLSRFYFIAMISNASHWSVYEVKSDHRRRMFKGNGAVKQKSPGLFAKKTYSVSSTLSSTTAIARSIRNEVLQWDPRLLLLCAISLLRLRTISGIRPWIRLGFKCQTLV